MSGAAIGTIRERPGEEGDDLPSAATEARPFDTRSAVSDKASVSQVSQATTKTGQTRRIIKHLDYATVLHIIKEIEDQIHLHGEVFDKVQALAKSDRKVEGEFKKVLQKAEADRKLKKHYEQKEREKLESEARYVANMEKMAKKEAVQRQPGKIKMIRMNVPDHERFVQQKRRVKTDWDMVRYFGDDLDWSEIPEGTT